MAVLIVSIIGVVIAAASAAWSLYQQNQQTQAQNKYQKTMAEQRDQQIEDNYALSVASANNQYRALQDRQQQETDAAAQKIQEGNIQGAKARSTALAAAGEAGVSGLSVNSLLSDFMAQEARYRSSVKTNLGYANSQLEDQKQGVYAEATGRAQSIQPYIKEPVATPDYVGAALRVGGSATSAYAGYLNYKTQQQKIG
jgi:hypothetical protein